MLQFTTHQGFFSEAGVFITMLVKKGETYSLEFYALFAFTWRKEQSQKDKKILFKTNYSQENSSFHVHVLEA